MTRTLLAILAVTNNGHGDARMQSLEGSHLRGFYFRRHPLMIGERGGEITSVEWTFTTAKSVSTRDKPVQGAVDFSLIGPVGPVNFTFTEWMYSIFIDQEEMPPVTLI